ncbi:MAG: hypothetical protein EOO75_06215, partial [Myxococcales bacterium]
MPRSLFLLLTPALLTSALLSGACATADTSFDEESVGGAAGSIGDEGGAAGDGETAGSPSAGTAGQG